MENENKNTRRKFLDKGLKIGLATVIGGLGLTKLTSKANAKSKSHSGETMELMTADGKLIQVDSSEVVEVRHSNDHKLKHNVREGMPNRKFVMVVDLAK